MRRPALFVELCGGLAAVSLRLQGGPHARPPVSRIGNKTGYARAILAAMGLRAGIGADAYLWCEPDPGARLLLQSYARPDLLAAAADVIRGWADREPRELWETLRAEGPIVARRAADGSAAAEVTREVARWAWIIGHGDRYGQSQPLPGHNLSPQYQPGAADRDTWKPPPRDWIARRLESLPSFGAAEVAADARDIDPREVARWVALLSANRLINISGDTLRNTGEGGSTHGGAEFSTGVETLAARLAAMPSIPAAAVAADAREIDPREVARWALLAFQSYRQGQPESGFRATAGGAWPDRPPEAETVAARLAAMPEFQAVAIAADARDIDPREVARWALIEGWTNGGRYMGVDRVSSCHSPNWTASITIPGIAARLAAMPEFQAVAIAADAREISPPAPLEGVYVYCDPPYQGTTGYGRGCELPRAEVVALARRWHEAGAVVAISEAEAVEGWADQLWPIDITQTRKGQKRTFSKQKTEILTLNRPPAEKPAEQLSMFGVSE